MRSLLRTVCLSACLALTLGCEIDYGHSEPYVRGASGPLEAAEHGRLEQRLLLLGDAGYASLDPYEPSLALAVQRARVAPASTLVLMLGDNVYEEGFPQKANGAAEYPAKQLALIDRLVAQLEVARRSGADLVLVPGNHDWEAGRIDDQANYVAAYASEHSTDTSVEPFERGAPPWPEVRHRSGVSVVLLDSTWLIRTDQPLFNQAMERLDTIMEDTRARYPDAPVLVAAHHPLSSGGIHGKHYTDARVQYFRKLREALFGVNIEDIDHPQYRRYAEGLEQVLQPYRRVIFAAGHDHNLQIAAFGNDAAPEFHIISGAASDVAPVWHEPETLFAMAAEGFVELEIFTGAAAVAVYTADQNAPVYRRTLWSGASALGASGGGIAH